MALLDVYELVRWENVHAHDLWLKAFYRLNVHFIARMEQGELRRQWTWEPRMGESLILLLVDPNDVQKIHTHHLIYTFGYSDGMTLSCSAIFMRMIVFLWRWESPFFFCGFTQDARQVCRRILEQVSNLRGLACGLQFLCSSSSALTAIFLGLRHALNLVYYIFPVKSSYFVKIYQLSA